MKSTIATLNNMIASEREIRVAAEKKAAVFQSERDAARANAEEERNRVTGLLLRLDSLGEKMERMQIDYEKRVAAERSLAENSAAECKTLAIENAILKAAKADARKSHH